MADLISFLLTFIPGLAFAAYCIVDYRKAIGKPVGKAVIYFCRTLAALVALELFFFALKFLSSSSIWAIAMYFVTDYQFNAEYDTPIFQDQNGVDQGFSIMDGIFSQGTTQTRETPNKLLISRKWAAWGCRKARFSAADYWITKAAPWLSSLTGTPLPQQAIIAGAPSTDSTEQTAWSTAPCLGLIMRLGGVYETRGDSSCYLELLVDLAVGQSSLAQPSFF
ncbi:hypothetical protein D3C80_459250 [compost metagenome]